jgi:hypothetical protein
MEFFQNSVGRMGRILFFLWVLTLFACKKDNGEQNVPPPTDRIKSVGRQIQRPGITIQPLLFTFAYEAATNKLDRITVTTTGGSTVRAFVYSYHPDGRPRQITELASDLSTTVRTIDFSYSSGALSSVGDIGVFVSDGRVTEIGNARLEYDNNRNVVRTFSINPLTPGLQLTNNSFSSVRNAISTMFDRYEISVSMLHILQPIPATDVVNRFLMSSSNLLNTDGGIANRLNFNATRATNGFATTYSRTSTADDDTVIFAFEYEPRQ